LHLSSTLLLLPLLLVVLTGRDGVTRDCTVAEGYLWQFIAERSSWSPLLRKALQQYKAGQYWPALLQYLLLAEQGCEVAVANAAFMLQRGEGAGGEQAMHLAARMLVR
jgi:SEL1 protein